MAFIIFLIIIMILIAIFIQIKKDPIYRNSPADPDYNRKLVTIQVTFKGIPGQFSEKVYTIKEFFYTNKILKNKEIADYLFNHRELYDDELTNAKIHFKSTYKSIPKINTIEINICNF